MSACSSSEGAPVLVPFASVERAPPLIQMMALVCTLLDSEPARGFASILLLDS